MELIDITSSLQEKEMDILHSKETDPYWIEGSVLIGSWV